MYEYVYVYLLLLDFANAIQEQLRYNIFWRLSAALIGFQYISMKLHFLTRYKKGWNRKPPFWIYDLNRLRPRNYCNVCHIAFKRDIKLSQNAGHHELYKGL